MSSYLFKDQQYLTDFDSENSFNASKKTLDYPNISRVATGNGESTIIITSTSDYALSEAKNIANVEKYDYIYADGEGNLYRSKQDENIKSAMVDAGYVPVGICVLTPSSDNGVGKMISLASFIDGTFDPTDEEYEWMETNCLYTSNKTGKQLTIDQYNNWVDHGSKTKANTGYGGSFTMTSIFGLAYNYEIGGLPKGTWYLPSGAELNRILNGLEPGFMRNTSTANLDYRSIQCSDYYPVTVENHSGWPAQNLGLYGPYAYIEKCNPYGTRPNTYLTIKYQYMDRNFPEYVTNFADSYSLMSLSKIKNRDSWSIHNYKIHFIADIIQPSN